MYISRTLPNLDFGKHRCLGRKNDKCEYYFMGNYTGDSRRKCKCTSIVDLLTTQRFNLCVCLYPDGPSHSWHSPSSSSPGITVRTSLTALSQPMRCTYLSVGILSCLIVPMNIMDKDHTTIGPQTLHR